MLAILVMLLLSHISLYSVRQLQYASNACCANRQLSQPVFCYMYCSMLAMLVVLIIRCHSLYYVRQLQSASYASDVTSQQFSLYYVRHLQSARPPPPVVVQCLLCKQLAVIACILLYCCSLLRAIAVMQIVSCHTPYYVIQWWYASHAACYANCQDHSLYSVRLLQYVSDGCDANCQLYYTVFCQTIDYLGSKLLVMHVMLIYRYNTPYSVIQLHIACKDCYC